MDEAPVGAGWLHEIKYDGYRMPARIDGRDIKLLTRTGLDCSHRYRRTIEALQSLNVKSAYLDGELCALYPNGVPSFSRLQAAMDDGWTGELVFFAFDLLFLNGQSTAQLPLVERKARLQGLFRRDIPGLRYSEHVARDGPQFRAQACKLSLEGAISKRADRPYAPGDRGIWVKSKCLNREEFVVVGWTDPTGSRSHIGALLLGYHTEDGRLHYAGRAGTGITGKELFGLRSSWQRECAQGRSRGVSTLAGSPPRRFAPLVATSNGSPLRCLGSSAYIQSGSPHLKLYAPAEGGLFTSKDGAAERPTRDVNQSPCVELQDQDRVLECSASGERRLQDLK